MARRVREMDRARRHGPRGRGQARAAGAVVAGTAWSADRARGGRDHHGRQRPAAGRGGPGRGGDPPARRRRARGRRGRPHRRDLVADAPPAVPASGAHRPDHRGPRRTRGVGAGGAPPRRPPRDRRRERAAVRAAPVRHSRVSADPRRALARLGRGPRAALPHLARPAAGRASARRAVRPARPARRQLRRLPGRGGAGRDRPAPRPGGGGAPRPDRGPPHSAARDVGAGRLGQAPLRPLLGCVDPAPALPGRLHRRQAHRRGAPLGRGARRHPQPRIRLRRRRPGRDRRRAAGLLEARAHAARCGGRAQRDRLADRVDVRTERRADGPALLS